MPFEKQESEKSMAAETNESKTSAADDDATLWSRAAERLVESRMTEFIHRTRQLPAEATFITMTRHVESHLPLARKGFAAAGKTCSDKCTCREEALTVAVAANYAAMSGGPVDKTIRQWIADFNRWRARLS